MPDRYDETRPENRVFLAHSRFIAPRRGSRFLSDTSVCPSGYASSYFLEVGVGNGRSATYKTSPTSWSIPKARLKGATLGETRATRCWSVRSCMCSMPDRTRPWRRRGIPVRSEAPDRIDMAAMMTTPYLGRAVRTRSSPARAAGASAGPPALLMPAGYCC